MDEQMFASDPAERLGGLDLAADDEVDGDDEAERGGRMTS
jgi:hypothetical protein